ncbi:MAG: hypothetical protein HZA89_17580 [Verrucomicrobia bacterium]|nr:hypothetical protein [Verrucomicrobiota bacterium]
MKLNGKTTTTLLFAAGLCGAALLAFAAEKKAPGKNAAKKAARKGGAETAPLPSPVKQRWELTDANLHRDFPAMALDAKGSAWIAFIEHDGKADVLKLARKTPGGIETVATLSEPGVVHQPAVTVGADGAVWNFWGQVDARNVVTLRARRFAGGKLDVATTLAESAGSDTFADAGTDHAGRVWVAWQSLRRGQGDIFTRWLDPESGKWSKEITVSKPDGGNWEPRLAFDGKDGAWIAFDSSRGGEFNLYLAHVGLDGRVKEQPLTTSPEYEARASIATAKDGKGFWIAAERGRRQWGMELRGHLGETGLNGEKRFLLGHFDIASGKFTEMPVPADGKPAPRPALSVNLPTVTTDADGSPWLAWRYYFQNRWMIAVAKYAAAAKAWTQPLEVPDSSFGQDRRCTLARSGDKMLLCWASDKRETKFVLVAGTYLAELEPKFAPHKEPAVKVAMLPEPEPYLASPSPDRPRTERHEWRVGGKTYRLYYGDLHRHTDFSNCRTGQDGCVLEHFRYAYDMAALDFLGTSDHTDIVKKYDPYEWWQTQRLVDVFFAPGKFTSLYAYEREQKYPWGHRNVVFAQRGGPIVYINRKLYEASQWNALYSVHPGADDITPMELWDVLAKYGKPVALISHTGATGMGTDWDKYEGIDGKFENTVEIFQGARVSYEGLGTPQPTVGLRQNEPYTANTQSKAVIPPPPAAIGDFGEERNNGVYQHALARGHKLGVFASSDHISTHTSFGGVYVENFTREGIIEGFKARRSIAATDKIFVEFSCDGKPMGSICSTGGKPELKFGVNGTAALSRVTLVRNEANYKVWEPGKREFEGTFTDAAPLASENRYYLRVEQADGNMAWSSPVWVTVNK